MKKLVMLIAASFIITGTMAQGEQTVAQADEITWFGLDFSRAVVIGESTSADEIADRFFVSWNAVVVNEQSKYDFGKTFKKSSVKRDMAFITELNANRDRSDLIAYSAKEITEDELVKHIGNYNVSGEGVGLVFVVENFNKLEEVGTMWVTFFDINTKQVLMAKHMSAKPGGFGMRNYWARTVYEVLKDSGKQYKKWIK